MDSRIYIQWPGSSFCYHVKTEIIYLFKKYCVVNYIWGFIVALVFRTGLKHDVNNSIWADYHSH